MAAPEPLSLAAYCANRAARGYDFLQTCFGRENYPETRRADYVSGLEARCMQVATALSAGRLAYDGVQAARCVSALDPSDCVQANQDEACLSVFEGRVEAGGDCYPEESLVYLVGVAACRGGFCQEQQACPGTCVAFPARGSACPDQVCGPDDYCDDTEMRCKARLGAGEACEGQPCVEGAVCGDPDGSGSSRCVARVRSASEPCDANHQCPPPVQCIEGRCTQEVGLGDPCVGNFNCPEGAFCMSGEADASERRCRMPSAADGPCDRDEHCQAGLGCLVSAGSAGRCAVLPGAGETCLMGRCRAGASCRRADGDDPTEGTCRLRVGEGEACPGVAPDSTLCSDGLFCTEQRTCELPGALGEPCNVFELESCEAGLWCSRETGTCLAPAAQGAACNPVLAPSCAAGLGCACGLEDTGLCNSHAREPSATDTCQPLRGTDAECYRYNECASADCILDFDAETAGRCAPPPIDEPLCLP